MRFRNKSDDARTLRPAGVFVDAGGEFDATPEQVPGLVLQCGLDGAWEPADEEAKAAVAEAEKAAQEPADDEDKPKRTTRPAKAKE